MDLLKGYRTYIIAILIGLTVGSEFLGLVSHETALTVLTLLGAGGLATIRAALK